jgi:hypothetical protein
LPLPLLGVNVTLLLLPACRVLGTNFQLDMGFTSDGSMEAYADTMTVEGSQGTVP